MTTKDINTVNMIINRAEADIKLHTGQGLRLIVAPYVEKDDPKGYNVLGMMHVIANTLGMSPAMYANPSRETQYVYLRMIATHIIKTYYPGVTLKEIGRLMGGKDHTSIIHYLKTATTLMDSNEDEFCHKYQVALYAVTQWLAEE